MAAASFVTCERAAGYRLLTGGRAAPRILKRTLRPEIELHPVPRLPSPAASWRPRLLRPLAFTGGLASLGIEFAAARLLAPFFGQSLFIWGTLIGLILIYLTIGYYAGGRLADRRPDARLLFQLAGAAALLTAAIPIVSRPILSLAQTGFAQVSVGLVLGSLISVIVLFAAPVILLGMVSPFVIRLRIRELETAGNAAGAVYALSTLGSILGTFVPVFWLIPTYGTRPTIFVLAFLLGAISAAGLYEPNLHVTVADGRYWMATQAGRYDVILVDAYRQPYIPFYLTTREFFESAKAHLLPDGVLAINVGRTPTDNRLVDALSGTLNAVFPNVFTIETNQRFTNTVIYATSAPATVDRFLARAQAESNPKLQPIVADALATGNIRRVPANGIVFTDDLAPVERLIDDIILSYIRSSR